MAAVPFARLNFSTALLLLVPPMMWAGNAVVGRLMAGQFPAVSLNFLRWVLAGLILLPLAWPVLRPGAETWKHWKRLSLLGLLGIGCYNSLQYLALKTSSPLNVTLVAASMPVWMLGIGRIVFGVPFARRALFGAALSLGGVLIVLSHGSLGQLLALRLVPGDALMLLAAACWATYSWLLARPTEPQSLRGDWAGYLLAQISLGLIWSGLFSAAEWAWLVPAEGPGSLSTMSFGLPLLAALVFVAIGPALLAYRCWGLGVQRAGPSVASFFGNLTPLFAALLSTLILGETPGWHHALAFVMIVGGIVVSTRH